MVKGVWLATITLGLNQGVYLYIQCGYELSNLENSTLDLSAAYTSTSYGYSILHLSLTNNENVQCAQRLVVNA